MNKSVQYPIIARQKGIEGFVIIKYVIGLDGSIQEIEVEKSVSKELDDEAIRVIKGYKQWYPAFMNGNPKKTKFSQPFTFSLN